MAGTGKSTISRTVARSWYDQKRLGATFFFSRGQGDLANSSKFFSTLAYQLACWKPSLATRIRQAIGKNRYVTKQGLRDQWEQLIYQPLSQIDDVPLLVIDALDECDGEKDIKLILHLLSQTNSPGPMRLKIFVTSRPETPIQLGFDKISIAAHRDFALHTISSAVVHQDISLLFQNGFGEIRTCHRLPDGWPDKSCIRRLVQKAGGLFIYASTVCRFIGYEYSYPPDRLNLVLQDSKDHGSSMEQLDLMYTTLLRQAVAPNGCRPEEMELLSQRFRRIVGSIVVLRDTLTAAALTKIIHAKEWEVMKTLRSLGSVLHFSEDHSFPITLLHPSFRDFLLDNERCQDPRFRVVAENAHRDLAVRCLDLLSKSLRQGICSLLPGTFNSDIAREAVQRSIAAEVRYACRYWVYHLQRSNVKLCDGEPLHNQVDAFMNGHFLHWLEALNLLGSMHDGILMIKAINSMRPVSNPKNSEFSHLWRAAVEQESEKVSVGDVAQRIPAKGILQCSAMTASRKRYETWFRNHTDIEAKSSSHLHAVFSIVRSGLRSG